MLVILLSYSRFLSLRLTSTNQPSVDDTSFGMTAPHTHNSEKKRKEICLKSQSNHNKRLKLYNRMKRKQFTRNLNTPAHEID